MATTTLWKQGTSLEYVMPLDGDRMLAITLPPAWLKADRNGEPLMLPPAVRAIDRLRALFTKENEVTPGFILSLREALKMTQEAFADKIGVSKMTVSRWECGRMAPSEAAIKKMRRLQSQRTTAGIAIDGRKR